MIAQFNHDLRICNVCTLLNRQLKPEGWVLVEMEGGDYTVVHYDESDHVTEGYLISDGKVVFRTGNFDLINLEIGVVDKYDGTRFEGFICEGIPFGAGIMYDANGERIYQGVMINWKRVGYGTSFHANGGKAYEGSWLNDKQFGFGTLYDVCGDVVYRGEWENGNRNNSRYEGDGSGIYSRVKYLQLHDCCILKSFDITPLVLIEVIIIGDRCFCSVKEFHFDNLDHLRSVTIGSHSFMRRNKKIKACGSFRITNCQQLESITIASHSFMYYTEVSLDNLPSLKSLQFGDSCFSLAHSLSVDGFDSLVDIRIGNNCFATLGINTRGNLQKSDVFSHSFHVLNCSCLKSIDIGADSFCDSRMVFKIEEQRKGVYHDDNADYSFDGDTLFVVKNNPSLESIKVGANVLKDVLNTDIENLPHLKMIRLGELALAGRNISSCALTMKDLPELKSLSSGGYSFFNAHFVTLLNIPIVETVLLPNSFYDVLCANTHNVPPAISRLMRSTNNFSLIQSYANNVTSIRLSDWTCNDADYTSFDFSYFSLLKELIIGSDSFFSVNRFIIDGLDCLQSLIIGTNSFTKKKNSEGGDPSRSFCIRNCPCLELVRIDKFSFSDFCGGFILKNLPSLQTINIGRLLSVSYNFYRSSFIVEDLPCLESIVLGYFSFCMSSSTILKNLPCLKSITLGHFSLQGDETVASYVNMKNLPNLRSLESHGESFQLTRIAIFSDIPNLEEICIDSSFEKLIFHKLENVSPQFERLKDTRFFTESLNSFGANITILHIPDNILNNDNYTVLDFSRFHLLKEVVIGNDSFGSVKEFVVRGLKQLKSMKIGDNSFTRKKNSYGSEPNRSFQICDCAKLEMIEIGKYSFSDFGGKFEVMDLPSLTSLCIGVVGSSSYNFYSSSFVVRRFPKLVSISLGNGTFQLSTSTILDDLPELTSIGLGEWTLAGNSFNESCLLVMRDLPKLSTITSGGRSFYYPCQIVLHNVPNLTEVKLFFPPSGLCFNNVKASFIKNVSPLLANLISLK